MKAIIIDRYFVPDIAPYALIVKEIAGRWVRDGHVVVVVAAQPSYKPGVEIAVQPRDEMLDGVNVHRVRLLNERRRGWFLRILNMLFFAFGSILQVLKHRDADVLMVCTTQPVVLPLVVRALAWLIGANVIYHCEDVFPEAASVAGVLKQGMLWRLLRYIDKKTCDAAAAVVVLSIDMKKTLQGRGPSQRDNIHIINNFILDDSAPKTQETANLLEPWNDKFTVMYAGNVGRVQGLNHLVSAAHQLTELTDIQFVFVGEGVFKQKLIEQAGSLIGTSVHFLAHQSLDAVREASGQAGLCVISLAPGIIEVAYPSKTMTCLAAGAHLLVVVENDSELSMLVENEKLGYVARPNDVAGLVNVIERAWKAGEVDDSTRQRARTVAQRDFSKPHILAKWSELIVELKDSACAIGSYLPTTGRRVSNDE